MKLLNWMEPKGNVKIDFAGKGYDSNIMALFDFGTKFAAYYCRK